jgi:alanine racemase
MRYTRAQIDLAALDDNLARIRAHAGTAKVLAVVKADGYGHGLERVASALARHLHAVEGFGVASYDDALRIRALGLRQEIVVLGGFDELADFKAIAEHDLVSVIHHDHQLQLLERYAQTQPKHTVRLWLKVDTGMRRLGFYPAQLSQVLSRIHALAFCKVELLCTHFARADELGVDANDEALARCVHQINLFDQTLDSLPNEIREQCVRSLANSGAVLNLQQVHAQWIRPGGILYGLSTHHSQTGIDLGLRPVMRLCARLIACKTIHAGDHVGYGNGYTATRTLRIGIAAIGYGDGYPRHAPSGTPVIVDGIRCETVGRVSMDLLAIDLSAAPLADVGSEVELWGPNLPVEIIARAAGTISYELTCGVTKRVLMQEK